MKLALLGLCAVAFACAGSASGLASVEPLTAPTGLHGFVYRANEPTPVSPSYTQLPAFAWEPVRGAAHYEIQLATSVTFAESTILADDSTVATPVTSLQLQVPWMTGRPFALWVRVRALAGARVSPWGTSFGFNTSWKDLPTQLAAPTGLIRWTPVEGATAYEVWFTDIGLRFRTLTNVADEREYWTFHPAGARTVRWRVRALRYVKDSKLPNKIQVITYGPYSPKFTSTNNTSLRATPLLGTDAISDVDSTPAKQQPNALMPGFAWSGTTGTSGSGSALWRVYVFSDQGCLNSVTVGSLVGGPAWAPRFAPPLALPTTVDALDKFAAGTSAATYGPQLNAEMADYTKIATAEEAVKLADGSAGTGGSGSTDTTTTDPSFTTDPGSIALPDNGWPAGRYWWTVVPVAVYATAASASSAPGALTASTLVYRDLELPQDACAAGHVWSFGMESMPVTTKDDFPLASGLRGSRIVASASKTPDFVQLPVITWTPVLGAQSYEIQLSRRVYPWRTVIAQSALVPSVTLKLTKQQTGLWYYRIRGVNGNLPGAAIKMTWSKPTPIRISGDSFAIVK
ncbi:MAG: hypothetical protein ACJ76I_16445 [Gaiellaceae bacterium]